nr:MAG TPA: hypothetical protein [Caudoviricetes sp.]
MGKARCRRTVLFCCAFALGCKGAFLYPFGGDGLGPVPMLTERRCIHGSDRQEKRGSPRREGSPKNRHETKAQKDRRPGAAGTPDAHRVGGAALYRNLWPRSRRTV